MAWDEKTEKLLREYWSKGHTASEIARMLGGNVTRNSVIGKAHRLKLAARATSNKSPHQKNKLQLVVVARKRKVLVEEVDLDPFF